MRATPSVKRRRRGARSGASSTQLVGAGKRIERGAVPRAGVSADMSEALLFYGGNIPSSGVGPAREGRDEGAMPLFPLSTYERDTRYRCPSETRSGILLSELPLAGVLLEESQNEVADGRVEGHSKLSTIAARKTRH